MTVLMIVLAVFVAPAVAQTDDAPVPTGIEIGTDRTLLVNIEVTSPGVMRVSETWQLPSSVDRLTRQIDAYRPVPSIARDRDGARIDSQRRLQRLRLPANRLAIDGPTDGGTSIQRARPFPGALRTRIDIDNTADDDFGVFRLSYRVVGGVVTNAETGDATMIWDLLHGLPDGGLDQMRIVIDGPGIEPTDARCQIEHDGFNDPCAVQSFTGEGVVFGQTDVRELDRLRLQVNFDGDIVQPPPVDHIALRGRLEASLFERPGVLAASGGIAFAGIAGLFWLAWSNRRARRRVELVRTATVADAARGLSINPEDFVDRPVAGLRPAEIGSIINPKGRGRDVVATIVDLAARGYLTIEAIPGVDPTWRIALEPAATSDGLLAFEIQTVRALGIDRTEAIDTRALRGGFALRFEAIRHAITQHAISQRWYRRTPEHEQRLWAAGGLSAIALGAATAPLLLLIGAGLLSLTLMLLGALAVAASPIAWQRSSASERMLDDTARYRAWLVSNDHGNDDRAAAILSDHLAFAVALDVAGDFLDRFQAHPDVGLPRWFSGATSVHRFIESFRHFDAQAAADLGHIPAAVAVPAD